VANEEMEKASEETPGVGWCAVTVHLTIGV